MIQPDEEKVDPDEEKLVSKLYFQENYYENIYLSRGIPFKLIFAMAFKKYFSQSFQ